MKKLFFTLTLLGFIATANAISLTSNIGSTETIVLTNTQGTSEGAITLTSTAGGVDIDAAAAKDVNIAGPGFINLFLEFNISINYYIYLFHLF